MQDNIRQLLKEKETKKCTFLERDIYTFSGAHFLQTSCGGMSITDVRRSTLVYFSIHGNTKKIPKGKKLFRRSKRYFQIIHFLPFYLLFLYPDETVLLNLLSAQMKNYSNLTCDKFVQLFSGIRQQLLLFSMERISQLPTLLPSPSFIKTDEHHIPTSCHNCSS